MQQKTEPDCGRPPQLRVLTAPAEALSAARNSRFISVLMPIGALSEVRPGVERLRAKHPAAAHVVHAAVVGSSVNELQYSAGDDGEPHGTAGRPALEVLKGSALTNVMLAVVRYFGGTRLGTGGLVRAYATAARAVLQVASSEPLVDTCAVRLDLGYDIYESARRALCDAGLAIADERFGTSVVISGSVSEERFEALQRVVQDATRGSANLERVQQCGPAAKLSRAAACRRSGLS